MKGDDDMTKITVYDVEAEQLEKIADANDTNVAEIIEAIMSDEELITKVKEDNGWR